jgi:hypothetical protein
MSVPPSEIIPPAGKSGPHGGTDARAISEVKNFRIAPLGGKFVMLFGDSTNRDQV